MKSAVLTVAAVTTGLLLAVACAKREGPRASEATTTSAALGAAAVAACDAVEPRGTCNEYASGTTFGLERTMCETVKGKFARGGCPAGGRIARCEIPGGEVKRYYAIGDHAPSLAQAKADCASDVVHGTFALETGSARTDATGAL